MIDAGATHNSTSLNRSLLRGHDLLHNLGGVLTHFCMRRIIDLYGLYLANV